MGTARGEMKDYMKHLYIKHNYMSMKMKFNQIQFPELGSKNHENDGFGHILEPEEPTEDVVTEDKPSEAAEKIAELEAELAKTKAKLNAKPRFLRTFDIPQDLFDYDEARDEIFVRDEEEFASFVESKCVDQVDRKKKILEFRGRVLRQVKNVERRKRNLSTGSDISFDSPSRRRERPVTEDDVDGGISKQSRLLKSQSQNS